MAILAPELAPGPLSSVPLPQPAPNAPLLTLEDWLAYPEDDSWYRTEVCNGRLVMVAAPRRRHQVVTHRLHNLIAVALEGAPVEVYSDIDIVIRESPLTDRRPDVVVIRAGIPDDELAHARDVFLVVEVLSPSTRETDLTIKKREYASSGIPEYWILDIDQPCLEIYRRNRRAEYQHVATITDRANLPLLGTEVPIDLAALTANQPRT